MTAQSGSGSLEQCRRVFASLVRDHQLDAAAVSVLARPLTPEEAIGTPGRRDFPILVGKERVIEAVVLGARGQAFTDSPREFSGQVHEVLSLPLTSNQNRALFVATLNALARQLGLVQQTVHCRDDAPELCGPQIATQLRQATHPRSVGLVGLNPAIAEALVKEFSAAAVHITDLNPASIGTTRFGVEVWDGRSRWPELVEVSDTLLVTGTTLVNGTFDALREAADTAHKQFLVFGVTAAAACHVLALPRLCPCAQA
ncbi:MAG: DUF364 domain-containing protein [Pseudomonadota bacterium]